MKPKEKWMVASNGKGYILLHLNEELPQYKKMKRIPNWIVNKILNILEVRTNDKDK